MSADYIPLDVPIERLHDEAGQDFTQRGAYGKTADLFVFSPCEIEVAEVHTLLHEAYEVVFWQRKFVIYRGADDPLDCSDCSFCGFISEEGFHIKTNQLFIFVSRILKTSDEVLAILQVGITDDAHIAGKGFRQTLSQTEVTYVINSFMKQKHSEGFPLNLRKKAENI